ncbi:MAG TPA: amidase family protein [Vicinamibacterales bacterium]|nr:amidase family protein [Vicinamibacterales bacterium]
MIQIFAILIVLAAAVESAAQTPAPFEVHEATIAQIHAAMKAGRVTCRAVVEQYLRRIDMFDKNGPALNAIVVTNQDALKQADALDARYKQGGPVGALHCIPMLVKDNMETIGLQSANGSLALAGFISNKDAFQVKKIKDAGAIVIAKTNMAEWAFSPVETIGSILPGYTRNPYALDRVTAGSSGGTAAGVAASFATAGLGSDTGNSIRGPSSHQSLVGIRSTMGLTSRAGIMPLNLLADIAGPIARSVEDAAAIFQVVVGHDPDDPVTAAAASHLPQNYSASLVRDGLKGARIGVLRFAYERESTDPEIVQIFMRAVEDLRREGATIIDPGVIDGLGDIRRQPGVGPCMGFKYDINRYFAGHGDRIPVKTLAEVVKSRRFHPSVQVRLEQAEAGTVNGPETEACKAELAYREQVRAAVTKTMDAQKIDAWVYPTWSNPPRLIGDLNTPGGDNSQFFSPTTGFPSIQVPMGYSRGGRLPAGITFFGRAWSEPALIKFAYAYEQATRHRRSPDSTPALR